jgi:hypothetical protein
MRYFEMWRRFVPNNSKKRMYRGVTIAFCPEKGVAPARSVLAISLARIEARRLR